jgi:hypothetical protein
MKKRFSKSTIQELIDNLGFDKAYDLIRENDPSSLSIPNILESQPSQGYLFDIIDKPLRQKIEEMNEFFNISAEDLTRPRFFPSQIPTIDIEITWVREGNHSAGPAIAA